MGAEATSTEFGWVAAEGQSGAFLWPGTGPALWFARGRWAPPPPGVGGILRLRPRARPGVPEADMDARKWDYSGIRLLAVSPPRHECSMLFRRSSRSHSRPRSWTRSGRGRLITTRSSATAHSCKRALHERLADGPGFRRHDRRGPGPGGLAHRDDRPRTRAVSEATQGAATNWRLLRCRLDEPPKRVTGTPAHQHRAPGEGWICVHAWRPPGRGTLLSACMNCAAQGPMVTVRA